MMIALAVFIAYFIGSIPTGYVLARFTKKIDIRTHGSGNVGATNVFRTVGKLAALTTLLLDAFKGFFAVTFLANMFFDPGMGINYSHYVAILGFCVVVGHNFSLFLGFKGGKGVATSAGVLLALCPKLLIAGLCVWVFVFILTRIVSLASVLATISLPLAAYCFAYSISLRFLVIGLAVLVLLSHRKNIERLLKKEEKTLSVKSEKR